MKVKNLGESLERIKKSYKQVDTALKPTHQNTQQEPSKNQYSGIENYSKDLSAKGSSYSQQNCRKQFLKTLSPRRRRQEMYSSPSTDAILTT